jgi:two-component system, LuxR family, sensor kinase FixL
MCDDESPKGDDGEDFASFLRSPDADLRFVAMTAMASTLAHELVQPLTAALNLLQGMSRELRKDEPASETVQMLDLSTKQILKAVEIIRRMRGFALEGKVKGQRESLRSMVKRVRAELAVQERLDAEVIVAIDPEADYVLADRIQIELVLMNLIANASEAVQGCSVKRIEIRTLLCGEQVELWISDSGPGLTPYSHQRLFDPLFTTKPGGTGLGLPICRAIVEAHGGRLWAESPSPAGAVFHMILPAGGLPPAVA